MTVKEFVSVFNEDIIIYIHEKTNHKITVKHISKLSCVNKEIESVKFGEFALYITVKE